MDKYKEVADWNRSQSGGHQRSCNHFDVIDGVLGTRDVVNFPHVVAAGLEDGNQMEDTSMSNLEESAHQTLAEDASRDTAENEADFNEDQPNQSEASFIVLERSLEEVQPRKKGRRSIEADKSPHIEARHDRKKRKKCDGNPPATDEDAKTIYLIILTWSQEILLT